MSGHAALADDPIEEKAKICATCHGEQGVPTQKNIPVIWGQNEGYLIFQLRDFKSGARKNDLMSPIAAGTGSKDISCPRRVFLETEMAQSTAAAGSG